MLQLVMAMTENGGVGYEGGLPWDHLDKSLTKPDMDYFKSTTMGGVCICGRKTYEGIKAWRKPGSYKAALPGRSTWVLSNGEVDLMEQDRSFNDKLKLLNEIGDQSAFLIGGPATVKALIDYVDVIHLNIINEVLSFDRPFPYSLRELQAIGFGEPVVSKLSNHITNIKLYR